MTSKIKALGAVERAKEGFDFDYWKNLAKKDPAAFETAREQEINRHIDKIPDRKTQKRLQQLQWRVEMERKRSKNPMDSAVRIYDMMWESVGKSLDALQDLTNQLKPETERKVKKISKAKVLKLKLANETTCTAG